MNLKNLKHNIDKFYFCPYHKEGVIEKYKKDSVDRKPNIGMLVKIRKEWGLDKKNLVLIGDKDSDIDCAKNLQYKRPLSITVKIIYSNFIKDHKRTNIEN